MRRGRITFVPAGTLKAWRSNEAENVASRSSLDKAEDGLNIASFYSSMVNSSSSSNSAAIDEVVFLGTSSGSTRGSNQAILSEAICPDVTPESCSFISQHASERSPTWTAQIETHASSGGEKNQTLQPHANASANVSIPWLAPKKSHLQGPTSTLRLPSPVPKNHALRLPAELATRHAAALSEICRLRRVDCEWPVEYLPAACFTTEESDATSEEEDGEANIFSSSSSRSSAATRSGSSSRRSHWCAACQCHVANNSAARAAHDASTAHLLKAFEQVPQDSRLQRRVQLPDHNRGFQLLAKLGFNELEGGLGAQRQGRREPIATSLKLDRRGLGRAPQPQPEFLTQPLTAVNASTNSSSSSQSSSSSSSSSFASSSVGLEKPAPRRVTHFPSHQPHKEYDGGISTAKVAQDSLSGRHRRGHHSGGNQSEGSEGQDRGEDGGSGSVGTGKPHGKKRRRGGLSRQTLDERLAKKLEGVLRRELSGSVPEGFEEYF